MAGCLTTRTLLCAAALIASALAKPTCMDRDDKLREIAERQDPPANVTSCSELASMLGCDGVPSQLKALCCVTCPPPPQCTDDDHDAFKEWFQEENPGVTVPSGCGDAACAHPREKEEFCCESCSPNVIAAELPPPDDEDPVHVYALGGQSNCAGSANANQMYKNQDNVELLERNTTVSKVWYGGLTERGDPDSFKIVPLFAGSEGQKFGPEVSLGHRLQELTGKRVLVVKYCIGTYARVVLQSCTITVLQSYSLVRAESCTAHPLLPPRPLRNGTHHPADFFFVR